MGENKIESTIVPNEIFVGSTFKMQIKVIRYITYNELKTKTYNEAKNYTYNELKGE